MVTAKLKSGIVEIHNIDDLLRVAEQVREEGGPLVLEGDDGNPLKVIAGPEVIDDDDGMTDEEAFLSSRGAWVGLVDGEELKRQIYAARGTDRPPVVIVLPE